MSKPVFRLIRIIAEITNDINTIDSNTKANIICNLNKYAIDVVNKNMKLQMKINDLEDDIKEIQDTLKKSKNININND